MSPPVDARLTLSPRELAAAQLALLGAGPNAVAGVLGVSPNTAKTMLSRVGQKLGPNWRQDPDILWPRPAPPGEEPPLLGPPEDFPGAKYLYREEIYRQRRKGRSQILRFHALASRPHRKLVRLSGLQRLFLRPALEELLFRRHLRLVDVDWNDAVSPPWLPLAARGRREVRAARYLAHRPAFVRAALDQYAREGLPRRLEEVALALDEARARVKAAGLEPDLPDYPALLALVQEQLQPGEKPG